MKTAAILMLIWFLLGGAWPWLVGAFLFWEFGGNASVIGSIWVSSHIHRRDHDRGP